MTSRLAKNRNQLTELWFMYIQTCNFWIKISAVDYTATTVERQQWAVAAVTPSWMTTTKIRLSVVSEHTLSNLYSRNITDKLATEL